jgi:hypothetical protein
MTFLPNIMHLLAEQTVGVVSTSVTFSDLHYETGLPPNLDDRLYRLYYEVRNPTVSVSDYHIYFNGDTTNANYESQAIAANGGATNFARTVPQAPRIIDGVIAFPNGIFFGYTDIIFNSNLQRVKYISMNSRGVGAAIGFINYAGANTGPAIVPGTGIFSIEIHSSIANAIDIHSRFRLYRISPI